MYIHTYIYISFHTDYAKAFDYVDHSKPWKILQEMGIPDHLTCLLRNLYAGQETTVRTRHGSKLGKEYIKAVYRHPAYLTYMAEYIMRNARLDESQAGIKIARRNINNLRYADDTTLKAESKEEPKSLLKEVKEESGKSWLKAQQAENEDHGIWSHHFMANRWGKKWKVFIFLGSKSLWMVTAAMKLKDTCPLEGKLWQT